MNETALIIGLIVIGLCSLVGLAGGVKALLPRTPCAIGDQRWETQQLKNAEFDKRLETGTRAFEHVRDEIRKGLDDIGKEMRGGMETLSKDMRAEMRRIEDKSNQGDKGLQELSKSMVNAITEMKTLTEEIAKERKG